MNIKNCRKCGRIFNYISGPPVCPSCREAQEKRFQDVKKYVRENKGAGISEIAENCEVDVSQIQQWIREERLVFADDSPIGINCEGCGAMIKTGRFCEKCKKDTQNRFAEVGRRPEEEAPQRSRDPKENPKMRFLDR